MGCNGCNHFLPRSQLHRFLARFCRDRTMVLVRISKNSVGSKWLRGQSHGASAPYLCLERGGTSCVREVFLIRAASEWFVRCIYLSEEGNRSRISVHFLSFPPCCCNSHQACYNYSPLLYSQFLRPSVTDLVLVSYVTCRNFILEHYCRNFDRTTKPDSFYQLLPVNCNSLAQVN